MDRARIGVIRSVAVRAGKVLFPHHCARCGTEGTVLCAQCEEKLVAPMRGVFVCPSCGEPSPFGSLCGRRKCSGYPLGGLAAMAPYGNPAVRELLRLYKYCHVREAGDTLQRMFGMFLDRHVRVFEALFDGATVVPVPMHPLRERYRGFSQSRGFADVFAGRAGCLGPSPALGRTFRWRTQVQTGDDHDRRVQNAVGSVYMKRGKPVRGRYVIIDDVFTTGATIKECARVLKEAGVESVWAVVLLKG